MDKFDKKALAAAGLGSLAGTAIASQPVQAQASAPDLTPISGTVNALGGLAASALAVAIVPIGVYFAIRIVKRVMNA